MEPAKQGKYYIDEKFSSEDRRILRHAIYNDEVDTVITMLNKGIDINSLVGSAGTPLCIAASRGKLNIVEILVMRGADVNFKNMFCVDQVGRCVDTPLMSAVEWGSIPVTQYLIANKADPNYQDDRECTPLHKAVSSLIIQPNRDSSIIEALLKAKADVNISNNLGQLPIETAHPTIIAEARAIFDKFKEKEKAKVKEKEIENENTEDLLLSEEPQEFEIEDEDQNIKRKPCSH